MRLGHIEEEHHRRPTPAHLYSWGSWTFPSPAPSLFWPVNFLDSTPLSISSVLWSWELLFGSWHSYYQIRNLFISLSNGSTAQGGPRPPSRVSSILPGLGRLFSNFYTLALLHLPPLHIPSTAWVSVWGAFVLGHWGGLSWINHRRPGVWHVLPISVYSACRISQCHSHHTVGRVLG